MGASLLAIAVGQAISMLNDTSPSRAGSLPQGICGGSYRWAHPQKEHVHPIFPFPTAALSNDVPAHRCRWFFISAGSP
ncbi:hypothetical protein EAH74_31705 [Pseudomonas mandelii]|uniref:Uncharacterized protein n=1 Tax=Pseudomonas mandelii TaxID=75612 RepID=A0A502HLZ6_9PSED|nr:hypothetical protein EAH74_31705 [Pseudomonas mandelii]